MTARSLRAPAFPALALLAALALACAGDRSEPVRVEAEALSLTAAVRPPALRVGENELLLELRDRAGAPVDGADIHVKVHMHAMGAMPAMGGFAQVEPSGPGRYRADFGLEMGGTWLVEIAARAPSGDVLRAEGSLTVGTPGLRLEAFGAQMATPAPAPAQEAPVHDHAAAPAAPAIPPAEGHPGAFRFDEARLRQIGVASEPARRAPIATTVRAWGRVAWDETALRDVTLRVDGFVGAVEAEALGDRVEAGQVLFTLYAPDLYAAQREYLAALRARAAARGTSAPDRADALVRAAERRLRLWDLAADDVRALARRGAPQEYVPIRAPISGWIVEKAIVAGSAAAAGMRAYRIAPLDRVWIEAEVPASALPDIEVGQPAEVVLPHRPDRRREARVAWILPSLVGARRTALVRLELENPELALRPDMYADVLLRRGGEPRLSVPESAVLRAGERSFVFLDLGGGHLRPQEVTLGARGGGRIEIRSGLEEGQRVVTAGTFLVASESRLRAALEAW